MAFSTVHVQYGDGSPARHVKVVLGFCGGMTKPAYTDSYGRALIEHSSVGRADIYVSGTRWDSFRAPGTTAVTIRS